MRKIQNLGLSAALFLVVFVAPRMQAQAGPEPTIRVEITEYGIYTADEQGCTRDEQGIQRCDRTNIRHATTTLTVPAQRGVQFGVKFRVFGSPDGAEVLVRRIWLLPDLGLQSPRASEPIRRIVRQDSVTVGAESFTSYIFDDPWELVPGNWTLEYWQGDHKLLSETFTVVKQ